MPRRKQNYGLVDSLPDPKDYTLGAVQKSVLLKSGDWTVFTPIFERQIGTYTDTWACVTFSALNCLEILFAKRYGFEVNFSDRFTAKKSGTIPGRGNTLKRVADSIRNDGFLMEEDYYWNRKSQENYYQSVPSYYGAIQYPQTTLTNRAKILRDSYEISYEWVGWNGLSRDQLREALQYGPLQVTVMAWKAPKKGVYDYVDQNINHAVTLLKVNKDDSLVIFDSYDSAVKVLSKRFYIGHAMLFSLKIRSLNPVTFANLYFTNHGKLPKLGDYSHYLRTGFLPFI